MGIRGGGINPIVVTALLPLAQSYRSIVPVNFLVYK